MTLALNSNKITNGSRSIKFLYSYGGKIVPRRTDGKLRYLGGYTRVLAVDRSITFAEVMVKFGELCGSSMRLKCKLPSEDLDVLVSVTSDEDLGNVIGEYDRFSSSTLQEMKIRAVLFPIKSLKTVSPPTSPSSGVEVSPMESPPCEAARFYSLHQQKPTYGSGGRNSWPAYAYPIGVQKDAGKFRCYPCCKQGGSRLAYLVPHWNHWQ